MNNISFSSILTLFYPPRTLYFYLSDRGVWILVSSHYVTKDDLVT